MIRSLWTAATGMNAQQTNMDVIANNLANSNTTGYKKSRSNFADLMYQTYSTPGSETGTGGTLVPTGIQIGMGVKTSSVDKIFTQGDYTQTGNQLDLCIQGNGFFQVLNGTTEVYTRAGNFKLSASGQVVDATGNQLQPAITLPVTATSISIDASGNLSASDQNGNVLQTLTLKTFAFPNPAGLLSLGNNYFSPTPASGAATEGTPGTLQYGSVLQGSLENSNTSVVEEMVNMIVGQRAYEASSKVIKSSDEMMQMANNLK